MEQSINDLGGNPLAYTNNSVSMPPIINTKKIKNKNYIDFIENGILKTLNENDILQVLNNIKTKYKEEARALIILLYYTGCRPTEALNIKAQDITLDEQYIKIQVPGSKRGLPRPIFIKAKRPLVKELANFAYKIYPSAYLFYHFRGVYVRKLTRVKTTRGYKEYNKPYIEITGRLRYYFNKWFSVLEMGAIPPYYLRHNRFTKLAENDADLNELRQIKGSKSFNSIMPYLHLSTAKAKKIGKKID